MKVLWTGLFRVAAIAIVALPAVVSADTLPAEADTQLNLISAVAKGGALPTITVKNSLPGGGFRGLVRFDLSALPPGTQIEKATLRAWVNFVSREGTVDVLAVLDPWSEAFVTEGTAPSMAAVPSGTFGVTMLSLKNYVSTDVTELVKDWLDGWPNNGVALVGGADDVFVKFDAKENTLGSNAMELEVVVSSSGPQGAVGPTGPAGPALSSFDSLAALPCTRNGASGTISIIYAANGDIALNCASPSPPGPDSFEPNDSLAQAVALGGIDGDAGSGSLAASPNLHSATDHDFFRFTLRDTSASSSGSPIGANHLSATITLANLAASDFNLIVYNSGGQVVGSSANSGTLDAFTIRTNDTLGTDETADFFVEVLPFSWAVAAPNYTLTVQGNSAP